MPSTKGFRGKLDIGARKEMPRDWLALEAAPIVPYSTFIVASKFVLKYFIISLKQFAVVIFFLPMFDFQCAYKMLLRPFSCML